MKVVLFVSHVVPGKNCGVWQNAYHIGSVLTQSKEFDIRPVELSSLDELRKLVETLSPSIIIYNYYPNTMGWAAGAPQTFPNIRHIFRRFEPPPFPLPPGCEEIYDDPTQPESPRKWITPRLVFSYENKFTPPEIPTFGSFGFVFEKRFDLVIAAVNKEYDQAIINLRIAAAAFGDYDGAQARAYGNRLRAIPHKPGIQVNITHEFLEMKDLIDWLAQNTANIFCYNWAGNRGPASCIDWALTCRRPVAINKSHQFKHLDEIRWLISVEETPLRHIVDRGTGPLEKFYEAYSEESNLRAYERILRG